MPKRDITGQKYGILTALRPTDKKSSNGSTVWEFKCECGNKCNKSLNHIRNSFPSCGCLTKVKFKENGYRAVKTLTADCVNDTKVMLLKNVSIRADNTSGVRGVHWEKRRSRWIAQISFKKKHYYLGSFENKNDAIIVRKRAEEMMYEPFLEWYEEYKKKNGER